MFAKYLYRTISLELLLQEVELKFSDTFPSSIRAKFGGVVSGLTIAI